MPANLAWYQAFSLFVFRFLLSRVGAQKHTPYKRPDRGGFMFVGCPIFVRQGRGVLHTPYKRPERGGFMFVGCPIFDRQGRGVLHTPHKTTR